MNKHFTMAQDTELLSVTTGRIADGVRVILTLRLDPSESFESVNFALSPEQAYRLMSDLQVRFQHSDWLKTVRMPDPQAEEAYNNIVLEQRLPDGPRRRRRC